MSKISVKLFVIPFLLTVIFVGCSQKGWMKITNDTNGKLDVSINDTDYEIADGEAKQWYWELDHNIFSHETISVRVSMEGIFKLRYSSTYKVKAGNTTPITVTANAGAVRINNNSQYIISAVYIGPSDTPVWGNNYLNGNLFPEQSIAYRIQPNDYDVRVEISESDIILYDDITVTRDYYTDIDVYSDSL